MTHSLDGIDTLAIAVDRLDALKAEVAGYKALHEAGEELSNEEIARWGALSRSWIDDLELTARVFRTLDIEPAMISVGVSEKQIAYARQCAGRAFNSKNFTNWSGVCDAVDAANQKAQEAIRAACLDAAKDARFWLDTMSDEKKLMAFASEAARDYL